MANAVQVVLRETLDNLGSAGEIVNVRPGYARNYLVPRGLAVFATHASVRRIEHEKQVAIARDAKLRKDAEGIAAALAAQELSFQRAAGESGKLFGSVTSADVAELLQEKGVEVDRRKITLPSDHLKEVGEHEVQVKLGSGVVATLKVKVEATEA